MYNLLLQSFCEIIFFYDFAYITGLDAHNNKLQQVHIYLPT